MKPTKRLKKLDRLDKERRKQADIMKGKLRKNPINTITEDMIDSMVAMTFAEHIIKPLLKEIRKKGYKPDGADNKPE